MSRSDQQSKVTLFPLVKRDTPAIPALTAVVRRLSIAKSLPEIMDIGTHAARILLAADGTTFVLPEGDLCYYAEEDAISDLWKGRHFPLNACISGWCMLERKAAIVPDIYKDERIPHDAYRPTFVRSLVMVPVRQDDPIAAMGAYWATTQQIEKSQVELLQGIANVVALSISQIELRARDRAHDNAFNSSNNFDEFSGLSKRQFEVLRLLAQGKTNVEIAKELSRSPNTIKVHVSAILDQLNAKTRTEAVFLLSKLLYRQSGLQTRLEPHYKKCRSQE